MICVWVGLVILGPSGAHISRLNPPDIYVELGGSFPERNPSTWSFSIFGRGFNRRDQCLFEDAKVTTRFRSSHRLDVTVTEKQALKKTGQASGTASIAVWDPKLRIRSNVLTLRTHFRALGG